MNHWLAHLYRRAPHEVLVSLSLFCDKLSQNNDSINPKTDRQLRKKEWHKPRNALYPSKLVGPIPAITIQSNLPP